MNEQLRRVKDAFLSIEACGGNPGYSPVHGRLQVWDWSANGFGNDHESVESGKPFSDGVVLDEEFAEGVTLNDVKHIHEVLFHRHIQTMVRKIISECVNHQWTEKRLKLEYEIRIIESPEYREILDEKRRAVIGEYFDGAKSALELMIKTLDGHGLFWRLDKPYKQIFSAEADESHAESWRLANRQYDQEAYYRCINAVNVPDEHFDAFVQMLFEAVRSRCGDDYASPTLVYRVLELLKINPAPVTDYLRRYHREE